MASSPAPTTDPQVLSDLKRSLHFAGLRYADGRQIEAGDLAPVLARVARRHRWIGLTLLSVGVLFLLIAVPMALEPPPSGGAFTRLVSAAHPWPMLVFRLAMGGTQIWLGLRCRRWARVLGEAAEGYGDGRLDAAGVLAAVCETVGDEHLDRDTAPSAR